VREDFARLQSSLSALHGNALLLDSESGDSNLVLFSDRMEEQFERVNRKVNSIRATTDTLVTDLTTANAINTDNITRDIQSAELAAQAIPGEISSRFNPILSRSDANVSSTMRALNDINTHTLQTLPNDTATVLTPLLDTINANVTNTLEVLPNISTPVSTRLIKTINENVTNTTQALPNNTATALYPFIVNNNTDEATQK